MEKRRSKPVREAFAFLSYYYSSVWSVEKSLLTDSTTEFSLAISEIPPKFNKIENIQQSKKEKEEEEPIQPFQLGWEFGIASAKIYKLG